MDGDEEQKKLSVLTIAVVRKTRFMMMSKITETKAGVEDEVRAGMTPIRAHITPSYQSVLVAGNKARVHHDNLQCQGQ